MEYLKWAIEYQRFMRVQSLVASNRLVFLTHMKYQRIAIVYSQPVEELEGKVAFAHDAMAGYAKSMGMRATGYPVDKSKKSGKAALGTTRGKWWAT